MKNQCKQEFAGSDDDSAQEFELSFVDDRPLVPLDTSIGNLPAVQRPLHTDKLLNVFEVAEQGERNSVIVFARSNDAAGSLAARQKWFEQHGKHIGSQLRQVTCELNGNNYVASYSQLLGRVAINTPGRLRDVSDTWLRAALERMQDYEEAASNLGLHLAFTPSAVATQVLFGEYYLSPFALLDSTLAENNAGLFKKLCSVSTLAKTLYWLIGGINLFEEDEEAALLSKWAPELSTHHAERLKAVIDGRINTKSISHLLSELNKGGHGASAGTTGTAADGTPVPARKPTVSKESSDPEKRGLNAIAGRQSIKQTILRLATAHKQDRSAFSIMLFGPSGCGKTYMAKRLAEELDLMLIRVRPSDVASMYVRESVTRLRGFFDEAVKNKPCMLFFDEFEFMVPDRDRIFPGQEYKIEEINELLIGLELAKEEGVFVIAATNQPFNIDASVFQGSRFDKIVYVGPPDEQDREDLLLAFLQNDAVVPDLDLSLIADQLDGFSAADLRALASAAGDVSASLGRCPISLPILSQALTSIKPSISTETEQRFAKFIAKGFED